MKAKEYGSILIIDDDPAVCNFITTFSGHGIPEDVIDKIFEPFFSTKKYGFGMGLPLVKQIVSEHLGEIKVESELGKGTTFRLLFPFRWTKDI